MFLSSIHLILTSFLVVSVQKPGKVWQGAIEEPAEVAFVLFSKVTSLPCVYICADTGKERVFAFEIFYTFFKILFFLENLFSTIFYQ